MSLVAQTEIRQVACCYAERQEGQVREQEGVTQEAEYQAPEAPRKLQLQLQHVQLHLRGPSQQFQASTTPPTANQAGAGAAGGGNCQLRLASHKAPAHQSVSRPSPSRPSPSTPRPSIPSPSTPSRGTATPGMARGEALVASWQVGEEQEVQEVPCALLELQGVVLVRWRGGLCHRILQQPQATQARGERTGPAAPSSISSVTAGSSCSCSCYTCSTCRSCMASRARPRGPLAAVLGHAAGRADAAYAA